MKQRNLRYILASLAIVAYNFAHAQLFIDNAQFYVQSGATVTVQGDVISNTDILGTGKVLLNGTANQNVNVGGYHIPNLEINNVSNATLLSNAAISGDLLFTNGHLQLGNYNLNMDSAATITNPTSNNFVVTNGTGKLVKAALGNTSFIYPIGNSTTTYNPVTISNSGTADSIGVRCLANVYSQGLTGTAFTKEVADASWDVSEAVDGGSNLSLTATWYSSDSLAGFNKSKAGLSYYVTSPSNNVGWDLLNSQTGIGLTGSGSGPFTYTRTGISSLGTFAIGTRPVLSPLLLAPKVFLQGPYNTVSSLMNTGLLTPTVVIPTTEPYSSISGFTHVGSGGGETSDTNFFKTNSIVDWVFVQLHDGTTGTVVSTRSALLKNDGTILDTDGNPLSMGGNLPGSYYFSVRHRNHLGVRTATVQDLSAAKVTTFSYNFASGLGQALTPSANAAMTNKYGESTTTTNYMLWAGDCNANKKLVYSGSQNDENTLLNTAPLSGNKSTSGSARGYYMTDLNLNGKVSYSGSNNDENLLINTSLLGNKSTTPTQQAAF